MKFLILALVVVAALADPAYERFVEWSAKYGKRYMSLEEHEYRFQVFKNNEIKIAELNAQNTGAVHAINKFSDLTPAEFERQYLTLGRTDGFGVDICAKYSEPIVEPTTSFDWSDEASHPGIVTPIKDQQSCGSCWAFCTAGTIESAFAMQKKVLGLDLSEQYLVSCDKLDSGCSGGLMMRTYNWLMDTTADHGIYTEKDYPYTSGGGTTGTCRTDVTGDRYRISSCTVISNNFTSTTTPVTGPTDAKTLKYALSQHGPLAVAVYASAWSSYSTGVLKCASTSSLNHAVIFVGYGNDDALGVRFYKIKNSWGPSWGEKGYIRINEEVGGTTYLEYGPCGLYRYVSYVTVA